MSDYIEASTHIDLTNQQLVFDSEGYYVVGDDKWQDITFTAKMIYNSGNIGIAPRVYDTNMFMFLSIHNETIVDTGESVAFANLGAQITYDTISIAQQQIEPLVVGTEYIFKTEIKGTNYRIYLNDKMIFNIEYPGMSKGKIGVYSTQGNACKDIQVDSLFADGWTTNITDVPGAIVDIQELEDENKYLYISNDTKKDLYAEQFMPVIGGKSYTLSFQYKGIGKVQIFEKDGADPKTIEYDIPYQGVWGYIYFTNVISTDCTKIALRFSTINDKLMVNSVQLEDKTFATDYIQNDSLIESKKRENSIITYPSKDNIKPEAGSMSIWFKPSIDYSSETLYKPVLFEYGELNPLRLSYSPGELLFEYGGGSVSYSVDLLAESWYNVTVTWRSDRIQIYYDGDLSESLGSFVSPSSSPVIRIGNSGSPEHNLFFGVIDETIVFTNILSSDEVNAMINSEDPIVDTDSMIMRATFNYAIGNFNKSVVEATLAPSYGSPVLIEKADGTAMRKVSFFDFYTGEYRTFNEELVEYDKNYDYVTISYNDKDIDQETFKVTVKDAEGIIYGDPYVIEGKKVYLALTDEEKAVLHGTNLYVRYQLEDSYTVDFNIGVPDSFRITLGKHDGQSLKITYEGNDFTDKKLATMIELNPMLNPNHEGFLYVTRNDEKVTSFRVKATPDDLPANGGTESLVIVEPLDTNGNYISHCTLDVSCELGTIIPAYDEESIKLRDRAGRFLYRYRSPILKLKEIGKLEVEDRINVIDEETGIGVQEIITLTTLREEEHTIVKDDTIQKIAEKYGTTLSDIAYAMEMTVDEAASYILNNVGSVIKVPINYSAKEMQQAPNDIQQDKMIAYLIDVLMKYMDKSTSFLPKGLGEILDFNKDGIISIREVAWLKENRLTTVLENKYNEVVAWYEAN